MPADVRGIKDESMFSLRWRSSETAKLQRERERGIQGEREEDKESVRERERVRVSVGAS